MSALSKEQIAHDLAVAYSVVEALKQGTEIVCSGDFKNTYDEFYKIFIENIEDEK